MRYLSVCSGIEAASVAWKPLGWTPVGYSEIEPFPRAVLEQRHGAVPVDWDHEWTEGQNYAPLFGDFTKIEEKHVGPVDLLVGGTPCQSFSIAGKRLGLDDPRGNLAIEFLVLAKRVRARWLVWENVPGVYSSWSGEPEDDTISEWTETADFVEFLNLFRECGYRGGWRTIDAQYCRVDGFGRAVPQRRRRCFLVGHIGNDARSYPVLFDAESLRGLAEPRRKAREGSSGASGRDLARDSDAGRQESGLTDVVCDPVANTLQTTCHDYSRSDGFNMFAVPFDTTHITSPENGSNPQPGDPCHTLSAGAHVPSVAYAIQERAVSENLAAGPQGKGWQEDISFTLEARHNVQAVAFAGQEREVAPTLSARTNGGGGLGTDAELDGAIIAVQTTGFSIKDYGADAIEELSPTLRSMSHADSHANGGGQVAVTIPSVNGWTVRKLTPRECERLQGFPDDFTAIQWRGRVAPDGPRYKAIGNSMAVNVMRWIGTRIALVERAVEEAAGQGKS